MVRMWAKHVVLCATLVSIPLLALPSGAQAAPPSDEPDLIPLLPETFPGNNPAPIYVDAYRKPGQLLYRFSSVLKNLGGAMDLYMAPDGSDPGTARDAMQVIWQNGDPFVQPDPNLAPQQGDPGVVDIENRSSEGASFVFTPTQGHNHWHFQEAAAYSLLLPGGAVRQSDKVGFCMWLTAGCSDGGGNPKHFPVNYKGIGPQGWCAQATPGGDLHPHGHLLSVRRICTPPSRPTSG